MKGKRKIILNVILVTVLVASLAAFTVSKYNDHRSRQDYEEAVQAAEGSHEEQETVPQETFDLQAETQKILQQQKEKAEKVLESDENIQSLLEIDLAALREVNEDVIGWIRIPDTPIDYPLLQWTDNQFYLKHTWKQVANGSGSIFMEWQNKPDFSEFNTIIYGHNMLSKSMFGSLRDYRNPQHVEKHPYVYIVHDRGIMRYDIFAMHKAGVDSIMYGLQIDSDQKKTEFLRYAKDYSQIDTDINPTIEDKVLTLSTCSGAGYSTRWVVQAILNEDASYIPPQY